MSAGRSTCRLAALAVLLVLSTASALLLPAHALRHPAQGSRVPAPALALRPATTARVDPCRTRVPCVELADKAEYVEESSLRGVVSVAGGVLAHIILGTQYCWGNFLTYAPASLLFFDGLPHPGMTPDAVHVLSMTVVGLSLGLPTGARVSKKLGPRLTSLIGCALMVTGIYTGSLQTRLLPFILSYSLLAGIGAGMSYSTPMIAGWSWFPKNKGLVNGLTLLGFGSGAFIFNKVGTGMAAAGVPFAAMLRKLAVIYACVSLFGASLVKAKKPSPEEAALAPVDDDSCEVDWCEVGGAGFGEAVTSSRFVYLWLIGILTFTPGLAVLGLYKQFALASGPVLAGDAFQSMIGGLAALANGFGRVFFGVFFDKIGWNKAYATTTLISIVAMLALPFTVGSKLAFGAAICAAVTSLGGSLAMFATMNAKTFGVRNAGEIYSVLFTATGVAAIGGPVLSKLLLAKFGWSNVFRLYASFCAGGLGLMYLLDKVSATPAPWEIEIPSFMRPPGAPAEPEPEPVAAAE